MKVKVEQKLVKELSFNEGQIKGVPKNPRKIRGKNYRTLKQSMIDDPEMLDIRELVAYPHGDEIVVVLGNSRLMIARELGMETIPVKILPKNTSQKKIRAYVIKDNMNYGEWDDTMLDEGWSAEEMEQWGVKEKKSDKDKSIKEVNDEYDNANAVYPIVPIFDEKYNSVIIVCETETDLVHVKTKLGLTEKHKSYKNQWLGEVNVIRAKDIKL